MEYSDFECPYCGEFARSTLPAVVSKYLDTQRAFMAFRHMPLTGIHPSARHAAELAECGRRQGRFWEIHDAFFAQPKQLPVEQLADLAQRTGADAERLAACINGGVSDAIERDVSQARAIGISGTPSFLFGVLNDRGELRVTARESGAISIAAFSSALDNAIALVPRTQASAAPRTAK